MTRLLPGVYVSLNDLSQIPEGAQSLNVGYVLKANRGPVNEWNLVTSPSDFLTKYTFSGTVKQTDDPTFHSILKVLAQTNSMYIVRAANNPLYGGVIVKKAKDYGAITAASKSAETITLSGNTAPAVGEAIVVTGTNVIDGYYVVKSVNNKVVTVTGDIVADYTAPAENTAKMLRCPVAPISAVKIGDISAATAADHTFTFDGNVEAKFAVGDIFTV